MPIFDAIELKKVSKNDVDFLYQMLKERDETVNVTHHKMPTYEMHKKFVMESNPYDGWYIILLESKKVGYIWIENNNDIYKSKYSNKKQSYTYSIKKSKRYSFFKTDRLLFKRKI